MKRALVLSAFSLVALCASYAVWAQPSEAGGCGSGGGCGGACPCGAGPKTAEVPWDEKIETPVEKVVDPKAPVETPTWTADELKASKPLLVYYFVEGLTDVKDDSYKLSQKFETVGLVDEGVLSTIKSGWRAKKVTLEAKLDRKDAKNQARIEFWSFTGVKLGAIAAKDEDQAAGKTLTGKLAATTKQNRDLCAKEIKRIEDAAKAAAGGAKNGKK